MSERSKLSSVSSSKSVSFMSSYLGVLSPACRSISLIAFLTIPNTNFLSSSLKVAILFDSFDNDRTIVFSFSPAARPLSSDGEILSFISDSKLAGVFNRAFMNSSFLTSGSFTSEPSGNLFAML